MGKVAIIGAGNVGAVTAHRLAESKSCEIVLIDVVQGLPQMKGVDLLYASPALNSTPRISGSNDYAALQDADVVVHTAGIARKPGMDRMDLLKTNVGIARDAGKAIKKYAPNAIVIAVANPLDIIAMALYRETGFKPSRVIGMAGVLDSTRFRYFVAEKLHVYSFDVATMVLGGHGDSMVPLPRHTSVGGVPLNKMLSQEEIDAIVERTRKGGGEIVSHLKTGSAFYAPGSSVALMVESIITNQCRIEAVCAYLQGEYGYDKIFLGVPAIIGSNGISKIIELDLDQSEKDALNQSVSHVQEGIALLDSL